MKILLGGSPCTYWSIAQKNNRETEPSGLGWELFENYLIAKEKFKPDFFLYENNKSAAQAIKDEIKKRFNVWDGTLLTPDSGARYIEINSALVSAQNRQRFYVHNCGEVGQPEDRRILLRDILESGTGWTDKSYAVTTRDSGAIPEDTLKRKRHTMVAEPVNVTKDGKAKALRASADKDGIRNFVGNENDKRTCVAEPVRIPEYSIDKARPLNASYKKKGSGEGSLASDCFPDNPNYSVEGKNVCINSGGGGLGAKTGLYACPYEVEELSEDYYHGNEDINLFGKIVSKNTSDNNGQLAQCVRVYNTDKKSICLDGDGRKYIIDSYANSTDKVKGANNKTCPVYEVRNGLITIKGKEYPIKLKDGFYIIRKLTVTECCRLQTMPDDYCRAVSNSQAYKGLGNGWTAEVIIHILSGALKDVPRDEEIVVLSMYDGIGTGRYCLDKMGFTNVKYYAYEIDKYAIQIAKSNYPDIIECGDAFQVRNKDWKL